MIIGNGAEAAVTGVIGEEPRGDLEKKKIIKWVFKLLYAGFETCFGGDRWDPRHQRCWDPIAKRISNPDVAPF